MPDWWFAGLAYSASMATARKRSCPDTISTGDRLSALPDALLHTILSSLKGRQMVETSVLSKRWRHLWRSVPCLDIDQREFAAASENWAISRSDLEKFEDFADNVLAYRCGSPAKLDTFRLRICDRYHSLRSSDTDRWIRRGLKCSPREFHLHFDYRYDSYLLEMHKLGSNSGCLTKLHLTNVSLHECFMEHITTVCTLLEVLELNRCSLYLQEITHPKLKNLVLHGPAVYDEDELPVGANAKCYKELIIRAPCLTYLNLVLPVDMRQISLKEMPSLVRASIRFSVVFPCKCNFLNVLFNVTSLELSGFREMVSPLFLIHVSCKHLC